MNIVLTGLKARIVAFYFLVLFDIFTSHFQPYIVRVSCHEALPNRNMLP